MPNLTQVEKVTIDAQDQLVFHPHGAVRSILLLFFVSLTDAVPRMVLTVVLRLVSPVALALALALDLALDLDLALARVYPLR